MQSSTMKMYVALLLAFALCAFGVTAMAETWTGGGDGQNWTDPDNWGGTAPTASTDAILNLVTPYVVWVDDAAGVSCTRMNLQGTSWTLNGSSITLTNTGLTVPTGPRIFFNASDKTIVNSDIYSSDPTVPLIVDHRGANSLLVLNGDLVSTAGLYLNLVQGGDGGIVMTGPSTFGDVSVNFAAGANKVLMGNTESFGAQTTFTVGVGAAAQMMMIFDEATDTVYEGNIDGFQIGVTKTGAGRLTMPGALNFAYRNQAVGDAWVVEEGELVLPSTTQVVDGRGGLYVRSGATLQVDTTLGDLSRTADSRWDISVLNVDAGGILAPGNDGIGTTTLIRPWVMDGTVEMEVDKSATPANDLVLLDDDGVLPLSGTIAVSNIGPAYAAGDSFDLFDAAAGLSDGGYTLSPAIPATGHIWNTDDFVTSGILGVDLLTANITLSGAAETSADTVTFNVAFNTSLTLQTSQITPNTDLASGATVDSVSVGADMSQWTVTVSPVDGTENGLLGITLNDTLMATAQNGPQYTINNAATTVVFDSVSTTATAAGPVVFRLHFENADSSSLVPANISPVNRSGLPTIGNFLVANGSSANEYVVTAESISGDGSFDIRVAASVATGAAGPSPEASSVFAVLVDNTRPTVAIAAPSVTGARVGETVDYDVTYTGVGAGGSINLTNSDITVNGTDAVTSVVVADGATSTPVITVTVVSGEGEITGIDIAAGTSTDLVGNTDLGASNSDVVDLLPDKASFFLETFESTTVGDVWFEAAGGDVTGNTINSGENTWTITDGVADGTFAITDVLTAPNKALENTVVAVGVNDALLINAPLSAPVTMEVGRGVTIKMTHSFATSRDAIIGGPNQNRYWVKTANAGDNIGLQIWAGNGIVTGGVSNVYLPRLYDGVIVANNGDGIIDAGDIQGPNGVLDEMEITYYPRVDGTTGYQATVKRNGVEYATQNLVLPQNMAGITLTQVELNLKPESYMLMDSFEVLEGPFTDTTAETAVDPDIWMLY